MEIYERIYRNVKALAQLRGVNLGDVEKAIKRTPGFLSRHPKISIDQLIDMAKFLGVGCDQLMNVDYEQELNAQNAREELYAAVAKAKKYFSDEDVRLFVRNVLPEE